MTVCSSSPLGLGNRQLPDQNFNASSSVDPFRPSDARLHENTSWVNEGLAINLFLQISFQHHSKLITGVATQGNPDNDWWVTRYNLLYSSDGVTWSYYEYEGAPGSRKVNFSLVSRYLLRVFSSNMDLLSPVDCQETPVTSYLSFSYKHRAVFN